MTIINLNDYEKMDLLGQGSFGAVFKIRNKDSREIFAAKIWGQEINFSDESNLNLLKSGVNGMAALNHPCILKFQGFSPYDNDGHKLPIIVTEFAPCDSLWHQINRESKSSASLNWTETTKLICIYGIAAGMKYLHSHGIIHRNLKPGNILLTEELFPKITGFELSIQIHSNAENMTTDPGTDFVGTPPFDSPEIYEDNLYSKASDVYAFGMTVYSLLTKQIPFKGLSLLQIAQKVVNNERPLIPDSCMNPAYATLIRRCWSHDPNERPSFEEIVKELESNEAFITESIDEDEYFDYIDFIRECSSSFDPSKRFDFTQLYQ